MSGFEGAIVITGANGGLGSRLAAEFLKRGITNIACHYRRSAGPLEALLKEHNLDPAKHSFQADLADEAQAVTMARSVQDRLGPVWGLVNLAGASSNGMSWKLSTADFMNVVNANLLATFHMIREFLPGMRERSRGRIVNVSSIVAHTGIAGAAHYCSAKAGVEGLTRAVAQEVASKKITVNCLALGYFDQGLIRDVPTDLLEGIKSRIPLKRLGEAGEIFPSIAHLLSAEAGFMTGQVLHLNGGQYS